MQKLQANKSFVNDSKVSDHHAIIPTEQFVQLDHMSNEERKIYDLVVRRFLAILSPACEYEETSISGTIGEERFSAKGNFIKSAGWREVYESGYTDGEDEDEEQTTFSQISLPDVQKGETLPVTALTITEGKTKPPACFTEGTLIAAMENPVKYLKHKDKDVVKTLGETGGLGTVATRADIIEKLFNSFLMEKKGNEIHITSKGKQLLSLVPSDLKSPELTASWEMRLQAIAKGKESDKTFMKGDRQLHKGSQFRRSNRRRYLPPRQYDTHQMSGMWQIHAGSQRKTRKIARLSGSGMRTQRNHLPPYQCPLPGMP